MRGNGQFLVCTAPTQMLLSHVLGVCCTINVDVISASTVPGRHRTAQAVQLTAGVCQAFGGPKSKMALWVNEASAIIVGARKILGTFSVANAANQVYGWMHR